jgi:hypothetical protein
MKKITLLTLLFVCAVTFGQQRVSELGPNNPVSIQKKQATVENLQNRSAENQTINAIPATQGANILGANNPVRIQKQNASLTKLQNRSATNQTINAIPSNQGANAFGANNPVSFQTKYTSLTNIQNRSASNETINAVSAEQKVTSLGANNPVVFQKRPSHSSKKGQEIELPQRNTNSADRDVKLLGDDNPVYYGEQGKKGLSTFMNNFGSSNQSSGNRFAPCTEENPNDFTFENGLNCSSASAFQTANDVTVAADEDFELSQITASIFANGGIASVDVIYYDNAGGLPGAVIGSELGLVPTSQMVIGSNFGFDVNEIVVDLTPFTFAGQAGVPTTYWTELSVTDGGGTGSVFWVVTSSTSVGNASAQFNGGWGIFDPALDGVYIWGGDCTPIGGGGGGGAPCAEENPNDFTFENGLNCSSASAFQTANDVTVAADEDFELSQITASIFANGGIALVDVIYYDDAGGLPGAVIGSEAGIVPTSQVVIGSNFGFDVNEIVLDLTPFTFAGQAGVPTTYWTELSVTDGGGSGSVFWVVTSSTSVGNASAQFNGGWGIFDPALDGVYIWGGDCIPLGGGGGGGAPCAEENPNDFTFENGLNCSSASAFQTANDVTVGADEDFELSQITASIFANGGIALVDVVYYDDAGGLPGAVIGSEAGIVPTSQVVIGSNFGFDVNEIVLDLTPFTFAGQAGVPTTYWTELSVTDGGGTGSVFWVVTSSTSVGNASAQFNGGWGIFDPALDGVYIWGGTCIPLGGGGGGPCAEENPNDFTFENGLNCSSASAFQTANDVTVAADEDFELDQITASIFANGGIALVDVIYYDDAGGLPGAVIGSEAGIVPTSQVVIGSNFGFDVNEIVLDLTPFTFAGQPGVPTTYWTELSVTDGGGTGSVFWVVTSSTSVGNASAQFNGGWGIFDPALDGVYIWSGTCTGGGGGGPVCSEENPNDFTFENGLNCSSASAFQTANDVTVADGEDFEIQQITASIFANGGIALVDVIYYDNAGGLPGAVIGSESGIVPTSQVVIGSNFGFDVNEIVLDVTPFTFAGQNGSPTTYWTELSVTDGGGTGSVFWVVTSSSSVGNATALFNGGWGIFDPGFDGVYIWSGECTPLVPDPTYDTCDGARPISCGEIAAGSTIGATVDSAVAPTCDTTVTAPGVWYIYEDTTGLVTDITITTCNGTTDYDAKLSVYTGDCGSPPLTCVVGNDDTCGLQPEVSFQSDGATTFYILVHGFASNVGNFEIEMICTPVPPPNDMIANSIDVDEIGFPYTDPAVAMPAATTEAGTPADCDNAGVKGVWYNFVPTGDGDATCSITSPAGFSSVTFYTAPNENSVETDLVLVDWYQNQCVPGIQATIPTVAGQAYYVYVANDGGITDIVIDGTNLGVVSNTIEGFSYYPNPTTSTLNLSSVESIENVEIYNMLGQKVIDQNVNATTSEINVSELSTGTYLMKVSVNGQTGIYKILKQ